MSQYLFYYQRPEPATWVYMSSFLILGIYFMFHRVWSIRNLDIVLLLLLTPGLMLIHESYRAQAAMEWQSATTEVDNEAAAPPAVGGDATTASGATGPLTDAADRPADAPSPRSIRLYGYIWLLMICAAWLVRMLADTTFFRRPLLEPNLTRGGLIFIGASLFAFLMANVFNGPPAPLRTTQFNRGPGYNPLKSLPDISTVKQTEASAVMAARLPAAVPPADRPMKQQSLAALSRILLLVANTALVLGIVVVGYRHFADLKAGVGAATLYLLLPYAAQMVGRVEHTLPGALIIMAIVMYRRPLLSGASIGLAGGLMFYPLFLLPLWCSFYWLRGLKRFLMGVGISLAALILSDAIFGSGTLTQDMRQMVGAIGFATENLDGVWGLGLHPYVRIPIAALFGVLAFSYAFWPAQKSLATLLNGTAATMLAAQFVYAYGGGLLMAWYLPAVLLTVFRPNLDDLVATAVVRMPRPKRRRESTPTAHAA